MANLSPDQCVLRAWQTEDAFTVESDFGTHGVIYPVDDVFRTWHAGFYDESARYLKAESDHASIFAALHWVCSQYNAS